MLKKISAFIVFSICFCSAGFSAAMNAQPDLTDLQRRVEALEQTPNRSARCAENSWGVIVVAQPLLWRASEDGLEYAIKGKYRLETLGTGANRQFNLDLTDGKVHSVDPS